MLLIKFASLSVLRFAILSDVEHYFKIFLAVAEINDAER